MRNKVVVVLVCIASMLFMSILALCMYLYQYMHTEDTLHKGKPQVDTTSEVKSDPYVEMLQQEAEAFYSITPRQDVKDDMEHNQYENWMLVVEEDLPIEVELPTYDPDDWRTYEQQMKFDEQDAETQMLLKYAKDFMRTNRGMSDYEIKGTNLYNYAGFYSVQYFDTEIVGSGHTIKWKFICGKFDDTPEDTYTMLVWRSDHYSADVER